MIVLREKAMIAPDIFWGQHGHARCEYRSCNIAFLVLLIFFWWDEQEKKLLSKAHLQKAMGNLEIKFRTADKVEVLLQNIVSSVRTRKVWAYERERSQQGMFKRASEAGCSAGHAQKKIKSALIKSDERAAPAAATPANHAGGKEENEVQSSPSLESPESKQTKERMTVTIVKVEQTRMLMKLVAWKIAVFQSYGARSGTKWSWTSLQSSILRNKREHWPSTNCMHCGEIHGTYAQQCEVAYRLLDKIKTAIGAHDKGSNSIFF